MTAVITNELIDEVWSIVEQFIPDADKTAVAIELIDKFEDFGAADVTAETTLWLYAAMDDEFVLLDLGTDVNDVTTVEELASLLDDYGYDNFEPERVQRLFDALTAQQVAANDPE